MIPRLQPKPSGAVLYRWSTDPSLYIKKKTELIVYPQNSPSTVPSVAQNGDSLQWLLRCATQILLRDWKRCFLPCGSVGGGQLHEASSERLELKRTALLKVVPLSWGSVHSVKDRHKNIKFQPLLKLRPTHRAISVSEFFVVLAEDFMRLHPTPASFSAKPGLFPPFLFPFTGVNAKSTSS